MSMKGSFLMMALMAGAMMGSGMNSESSTGSRFDQPILPEEKKILPGQFKGTIPKGCKITTIGIETKWQGYLLTNYVDIIYGSEKAKQKAIVKAEYQIKEYLEYRKNYGREVNPFHEFDIVMELPKKKDTTFDKFIKS